MKCAVGWQPILLLFFCSWLYGQTSNPDQPAAQIQQGRRLFQQRCGICHTSPLVFSRPYGPYLNKQVVAGREGSVRNTIMEGETGLMPGFRYTLDTSEIKAIIEYLKTVEPLAHPVTNWVAEH